MRKKLFAIMIVAVVAAFAGYNMYQSQKAATLSDLALANVEALAFDPEWGSTSSPCAPSMPNSCTWVKRIGFQQYLVTEDYARYIG